MKNMILWGMLLVSTALASKQSPNPAISDMPPEYVLDDAGNPINNIDHLRMSDEEINFDYWNSIEEKNGCFPTISCTHAGGYCIKAHAYCDGTLDRQGCRRGRKCQCCIPDQATSTLPACPAVTCTPCPTTPMTTEATSCVCGKANSAKKIVNGIETEVNEYPWQVALIAKGESDVFCGGSLINDRWVLTAAHCTPVHQVLLGSHQQSQTDPRQIRVDIIRNINHPNYDSITVQYDFSLLELASSLDLEAVGPYIAPVCLPTDNNSSKYDNVEAIVSGWGTIFSGGPTSDVLLDTTVKTMTNIQCNKSYGGNIFNTMICASSPGKDACQGDSGGPMVTDAFVDYFNLIGVVSWGFGCAKPKFPGVYSRVTSVVDWITSTSSTSKTCPPPS